MREVRKIRIPPTLIETYEEKEFVKCSFCGKEANGPQRNGEISWPLKSRYDVAATAIYWKDGTSFSEGGSGEYHEIHACPECFKEKVIPVLENCALPAGVKFQETSWDW